MTGVLKFRPIGCSFAGVDFWQQLSEIKKNVWKLDDNPQGPIYGFLDNVTNRLIFSFEKEALGLPYLGIIINVNSMEDFKARNKTSLIESMAKDMIEEMRKNGCTAETLNRFLVFSFSNLKSFKHYYLMATPVLSPKTPFILNGPPQSLNQKEHDTLIANIGCGDKSFFGIAESLELVPLSVINSRSLHGYGFRSSSTTANGNFDFVAEWPLRNFLFWIWFFHRQTFFKLFYIMNDRTLVLDLSTNSEASSNDRNDDASYDIHASWERKDSKIVPKLVDLSSNLDPKLMMESAVDLNLKLMTWRNDLQLDLNVIKVQKCLLLGAGTLGCNVARLLMSWGISQITFVDNGIVSFSNPVRQSLYNFEDCYGSAAKGKATCAALNLEKVNPLITAVGVEAFIPMPGHPCNSQDLQIIVDLIKSHDVIFVLTDSREGRWLPSILAQIHQKLLINVALGYDSYLVIQNDYRLNVEQGKGVKTGCYFCSDVVAPGNSLSNRTLDQQCTVVRPGVSYMASALAVEMLVDYIRGDKLANQMRGFLSSNYQNHLMQVPAYDKCTCCSDALIQAYTDCNDDGEAFLLQIMDNPLLLEKITGLDVLKNELEGYDDISE